MQYLSLGAGRDHLAGIDMYSCVNSILESNTYSIMITMGGITSKRQLIHDFPPYKSRV